MSSSRPNACFLLHIGPLLDTRPISGGFLSNIPRIFPEGVSVQINRGTWPELPIFGLMQRLGNADEREMFRSFNKGIGMVVITSELNEAVVTIHIGESFQIGGIITGKKNVSIT
jgi:phosphoribosylformylglycinamidine cyclo-ligase